MLVGKRLGLSGQVGLSRDALDLAFSKLGLPAELCARSHLENQRLLREAREMGARMAARIAGKGRKGGSAALASSGPMDR